MPFSEFKMFATPQGAYVCTEPDQMNIILALQDKDMSLLELAERLRVMPDNLRMALEELEVDGAVESYLDEKRHNRLLYHTQAFFLGSNDEPKPEDWDIMNDLIETELTAKWTVYRYLVRSFHTGMRISGFDMKPAFDFISWHIGKVVAEEAEKGDVDGMIEKLTGFYEVSALGDMSVRRNENSISVEISNYRNFLNDYRKSDYADFSMNIVTSAFENSTGKRMFAIDISDPDVDVVSFELFENDRDAPARVLEVRKIDTPGRLSHGRYYSFFLCDGRTQCLTDENYLDLLSMIPEEGTTIKQLADKVGIDQATVGRDMTYLAAIGFVKASVDQKMKSYFTPVARRLIYSCEPDPRLFKELKDVHGKMLSGEYDYDAGILMTLITGAKMFGINPMPIFYYCTRLLIEKLSNKFEDKDLDRFILSMERFAEHANIADLKVTQGEEYNIIEVKPYGEPGTAMRDLSTTVMKAFVTEALVILYGSELSNVTTEEIEGGYRYTVKL